MGEERMSIVRSAWLRTIVIVLLSSVQRSVVREIDHVLRILIDVEAVLDLAILGGAVGIPEYEGT